MATPAGPSLAGRWSGHIWGIKGDPSRCEDGNCTMTVDLVPCGNSWCGIEVKQKDNGCGRVSIRLQDQPKDAPRDPSSFEGRLDLAKSTESFAIQLTYRETTDGKPPYLHLIGNTGPKLMLFRRSFPLEASLERTGDALCRMEDATS